MGREYVLGNEDLLIGVVNPTEHMDYFYRNGDGDELLFWIFNVNDFEPITGRIHQPPPVHQTFEGENFVICSFVPRLYDYHSRIYLRLLTSIEFKK